MKIRVWLGIFLAVFFVQKNVYAKVLFPKQNIYEQNILLSAKDALRRATTLYVERIKDSETDEYLGYHNALEKYLRSESSNPSTKAAQDAALVLSEILTNSFLWCLHAHLTPQQHPMLRGIYTLLWRGLSETGWSLWSNECLQELEKINKKKRLLYIAGGVDIVALLSSGIYNFDIIDPILETQKEYYFPGYEWLTGVDATSKIGDIIKESFGDKILTLKRIYNSQQTNRCVWEVSDEQGIAKGQITFTKRLLDQKDLITTSEVIISFNELIFLILPKQLGGWSVDFIHAPYLRNIYVKQLSKPLDVSMLRNLRILLTLATIDLKFIALGNDIE